MIELGNDTAGEPGGLGGGGSSAGPADHGEKTGDADRGLTATGASGVGGDGEVGAASATWAGAGPYVWKTQWLKVTAPIRSACIATWT